MAEPSIADLQKQIAALEHHIKLLKNRECLCPDCRDKVRPGECPRCALQSAEAKIDRLKGLLK